MKIAITGEGKTDFGQKEYSTGKWLPGPAIVYAENIAKEKGAEVEFIPIEKGSNRIAVTKHYETVYKEVKDGLNSDKGIPMIPLSMIECWILADKSALEQVFELEIQQAKMPAEPEYIWGNKNDSGSDYPKNYLVRMIRSLDNRYQTYTASRENFYEIAKCSEISTLREKCSISYERFYKDFEQILSK